MISEKTKAVRHNNTDFPEHGIERDYEGWLTIHCWEMHKKKKILSYIISKSYTKYKIAGTNQIIIVFYYMFIKNLLFMETGETVNISANF